MTTVANVLTAAGYRLFPDGTAISSSTEPSQAECIQWINEICQELLTICIESGSELGRASGSVSLVDGTSTYTTLATLMLAPVVYQDNAGESFSGWIEKTTVRNPLKLCTEARKLEYDPSLESEPLEFYVNSANGLVFLPTPDASYTAVIPYYAYLTALTLTTDTIPFYRVFDNVIIESLVIRAQNREEYDLTFELNWFSYIRKQARMILYMRKNPTASVML